MFSVYPFPLWWLGEYIYFAYYHHQIGSMNYYPLFRVRSWNNGVRCMSFYILKGGLVFCWTSVNQFPVDGIAWGYPWTECVSMNRNTEDAWPHTHRVLSWNCGNLLREENMSATLWKRFMEKSVLFHINNVTLTFSRPKIITAFTMMSHQLYGVSNHRQLGGLFSGIFLLKTKKP